jgi:anti-sigma factor RsiW
MKHSCSVISKLLEKYFDQEATDEERSFVDAHLAYCHACQEMLGSMEKIRDSLKAPVEEAAKQEDFPWVWEKIEKGIRKEEKRTFWESLPSWLQIPPFFRRRVWIPAVAAIVVALVITFPLLLKKTPSSPSTSVVEYLESDTNNVMVYDSENSKMTLIWLFEEPEKEPDAV